MQVIVYKTGILIGNKGFSKWLLGLHAKLFVAKAKVMSNSFGWQLGPFFGVYIFKA